MVNTEQDRQPDRHGAQSAVHTDERAVEHAAEHTPANAAEFPAEHGRSKHDPHAEPSAEWGWHGGFPRAARIGGWTLAAIMFLMLIGNHEGNIENLWLISIGLIIVGMLVADQIKRRTSWRR